jgi:regulator of protease activity HflC (stomatin/prohibitin superfamily)
VDTFTALLLVVGFAVVVILVIGATVSLVTVHDYERGLRYSRGRFRGLVTAGSYVVFKPLAEIRVLDARPGDLTIDGQEILLADGTTVKISLVARHVLGDAVTAVTGDRDAWRSLYLTLQLRLREVVAGQTLDQVLASRTEIGPAIRERAASSVSVLGLELLSVDVRDVTVTGELRRAFASVVAARKEAEAALERVRGETAALRNLANAGRMVEDNPALLQLRLLQQLGGTSGNTLMVNVADGVAAPLVRERVRAAAPAPATSAPATPEPATPAPSRSTAKVPRQGRPPREGP